MTTSSTKNVKLGVCYVYFGGVNLGLTQGGVEVTVKTDTHKTNVDQYGKSTINEFIMGRDVMAKVPMAETTVENLAAIMPGSTLVYTGGTVASGTITIATQPTAGMEILVNGKLITFVAAADGIDGHVVIGSSAANTALALAAALNATTDPLVALATYTAAAAVVTVTYGNALTYGAPASAAGPAAQGGALLEGNNFTLGGTSYLSTTTGAPVTLTMTAGASVTFSGAALTGGADPTYKSITTTTNINANLLSTAKELRFHPIYRVAGDKTEDFVVPLANCPGAINFAYKLENERIYNVDFNGYPDPITGKLFGVGI
jgi:hypothetical protein